MTAIGLLTRVRGVVQKSHVGAPAPLSLPFPLPSFSFPSPVLSPSHPPPPIKSSSPYCGWEVWRSALAPPAGPGGVRPPNAIW